MEEKTMTNEEVIERISEIGEEENPEEREELIRELMDLEEEEPEERENRGAGLGWGLLGGAAVMGLYLGGRFAYKKGKQFLENRKAKKKSEPIDTEFEERDIEEDFDDEEIYDKESEKSEGKK